MRYGIKWPEYARQWDRMKIRKGWYSRFAHLSDYLLQHKATYRQIEGRTGVPWFMIAALHWRESTANFNTYLGNGERLDRRTRLVPKGRGPFASFSDGAVDALRIDGLSSIVDWRLEKILYYCEIFNGTGYANRGLPSPYVWGGSTIQRPGKYVADGRFDPSVWDTQPGCAPMIYTFSVADPSIKFTRES